MLPASEIDESAEREGMSHDAVGLLLVHGQKFPQSSDDSSLEPVLSVAGSNPGTCIMTISARVFWSLWREPIVPLGYGSQRIAFHVPKNSTSRSLRLSRWRVSTFGQIRKVGMGGIRAPISGFAATGRVVTRWLLHDLVGAPVVRVSVSSRSTKSHLENDFSGGEGGIRTLGTVASTPD